MIIPVILAGGSGTRLWPLSRKLHPKQVLALLGDRTLVQETVLRLRGLDAAAPVVICNDEHRFIVAEQLRDLDERPAALILEPVARNTAPAVAVAALYALAQSPDATLLMLPADHLITDSSAFHTAVVQAVDYARDGHLVTFGIVPAAPETGYGYIMQGAAMPHGPGRKIQRFVEKPDTATAEGYVRSGQYFWNSGMFVLRADAVLAELTRFAPEIVRGCRESLEKAVSDLDFLRLDHDAFAGCPEDSEKSGDGTDADKGSEDKKIRLKVRNKTGRPTYYRAGLCFVQVDVEYEVAKDIADILLVDPWLVAGEIK